MAQLHVFWKYLSQMFYLWPVLYYFGSVIYTCHGKIKNKRLRPKKYWWQDNKLRINKKDQNKIKDTGKNNFQGKKKLDIAVKDSKIKKPQMNGISLWKIKKHGKKISYSQTKMLR